MCCSLRKTDLSALGLSLLLIWISSAETNAGLITPISSELRLGVEVTAPITLRDTDTSLHSQTATLNPLSGSVSATAGSSSVNVTAQIDALATWQNSDLGSISYAGTRFEINGLKKGSANFVYDAQGFTYAFLSNVNGEFVVDYDIAVADDNTTQVLGQMLFALSDGTDTTVVRVNQDEDPSATGEVRFSLVAGESYEFLSRVDTNYNWIASSRFDDTETLSATIDFGVDAVAAPEPSTSALMSLGLIGLAGYGWRHKRTSNTGRRESATGW